MKHFLLLSLIFLTFLSKAQTIIKIQDGVFVSFDGGSNIIVSNPSNNPIRKTGTSGGILTTSENQKIILDISNSTGIYNIPFVSSVGNTIPFTYNITSAGSSSGKISFSSYETGNSNLPYPSGVTNVKHAGIDNSQMVIDRFWLVDVYGYTTKPQGAYTFTYDDNDLVGNTIYEPGLFMQRWNSDDSLWGDWLYSTTADVTTNTIRIDIANPQDQYKVWTAVDQGQPLPIELISFKSNCNKKTIEWTTASEVNNEMFILQGSNDLVNVVNLDTIPGAGFSNQILNYSLSIQDWGISYFRLKQVDYDGQSKNSDWISGCPENGVLEPVLFPNPNNGQFIIKHNSTYTFEVYDMIGQIIWSEKSSRVNFDFNTLSDGKYFIKLTDNYGKIKTFKFVKIN